jgi:hypothetical protein
MHAQKVSHKILNNACSWMHAARRNALAVTVLAAINERRLSVTGLGRAIDSDAKEKHCIKRADRLIGNVHLYSEYQEIYHSFARHIIGTVRRPVILVDWSDLDPYKNHFLLRASVAVDGRSLSLYEEVHGLDTKEKPTTHKSFLNQLKKILPEECRPILVTDAGFRTPWFKLVDALGWDWVGRLRNRHLVRTSENETWFHAKELYENANATPRYLGQKQLTRSAKLQCHFVLYKGKPKGRSKITCNGERARSKHSEQCAQREREPWLLVTSLPATSKLAQKVVSIYSTRMQIEESFRDVKSVRFGIGFELNLSRSAERLQILLLVAMIATFVLWLLGMAARNSQQHLQYQANTVKDRQVLSAIYLGLRVATDRRFEFNLSELNAVAILLRETVRQHGDGW